MVGNRTPVEVTCKDCSFEKLVDSEADVKPADVLIEHGQRTGHTLSVSRIAESED